MKILVACEYSGIVRDAFLERGHDAVSCDILPSERAGPHIKDDVLNVINQGSTTEVPRKYPVSWDMMIAFPPCTHICVSGARWFAGKQTEQKEAVSFFMALVNAPVPKICIENPVGIMSTVYHKPDQYIQPWQYGHGETKKTGLWLKNLPLLQPTNIVPGRLDRIHKMAPSYTRGLERSRTYLGIARAMANQWG